LGGGGADRAGGDAKQKRTDHKHRRLPAPAAGADVTSGVHGLRGNWWPV